MNVEIKGDSWGFFIIFKNCAKYPYHKIDSLHSPLPTFTLSCYYHHHPSRELFSSYEMETVPMEEWLAHPLPVTEEFGTWATGGTCVGGNGLGGMVVPSLLPHLSAPLSFWWHPLWLERTVFQCLFSPLIINIVSWHQTWWFTCDSHLKTARGDFQFQNFPNA